MKERLNINIKNGLSSDEVIRRINEGKVNTSNKDNSKSYKQIIADNTFTLFNLVNIVLASLVAITGSFKNLFFIGIVLLNVAIGIIQEIRAKKILDKITLLVSTKVKVLRDGKEQTIEMDQVVIDDIVVLSTGNQVVADSILKEGYLEVNESLLTGESDIVKKVPGDFIYSGSFITSGSAKVQVENVGEDNYASKISEKAKEFKKYKSEINDSLNKILKFVSIIILPVGIILFSKSYFINGLGFNKSILSTTAALIGMVPEGLMLLTSISLAVGAINLAKKRTLVQELNCLESLARIDVLCLDKTGTITEGKMEVKDIVIIDKDYYVNEIMGNLVSSLNDDNFTFLAIKDKFDKNDNFNLIKSIPFSSQRKYSGAVFEEGTYIMGAYEFIFKEKDKNIIKKIQNYSKQGNRVLVLAKSSDESLSDVKLISIILIVDKIREGAKQTLEYFKEQGVDIKIISGDNHITVSEIAKRVGLQNAHKCVDATTLKNKKDIEEASKNYSVFGRVTPEQKKELVSALKGNGHVVAMTGDGVNDVMALKEANCSIAMANGSDVAKSASNLVLLDNDFGSLPFVLYEGRRVINNIEKVASLFLNKTIYSILLAIIIALINVPYPFVPVQLSVISAFSIGLPSFIFALEPNRNKVKGNFLQKVLDNSLPNGIAVLICILVIMYQSILNIPEYELSRLYVYVIAINGLIVMFKVSKPFTLLKTAVCFVSSIGVIGLLTYFSDLLMLRQDNFFRILAQMAVITVMLLVSLVIVRCVIKLLKAFISKEKINLKSALKAFSIGN